METWYKFSIPNKRNKRKNLNKFKREFNNLKRLNTDKQEVTVFANQNEGGYEVFISPKAATIAMGLLDKYSAVECAKPSTLKESNIIFLTGAQYFTVLLSPKELDFKTKIKSYLIQIHSFFLNHKKLFISLITVLLPLYFLLRPTVQITYFKLLNPIDPFSALFEFNNHSNLPIENIDYEFFISLNTRGINFERVGSSHNNDGPNYQSIIPRIKSHEKATLSKAGIKIDFNPGAVNYASIIIAYSYDYLIFNLRDSVLFKTNMTSKGEYEWSQYSFDSGKDNQTPETSKQLRNEGFVQYTYENNFITVRPPDGWMKDDSSGFIYPIGDNKAESKTVMYVNMIDKSVKVNESIDKVIDNDIYYFKSRNPDLKVISSPDLVINENKIAIVKKFVYTKLQYTNYEAVAYINEPTVVGVVVITSRSKDDLEQKLPKFEELLNTYSFYHH
ncbi:MAG: hypothetical protein A2315_07135 [Ignavibacteria bacterium RIFOXYB2_FULL_35_12]|nr:MAG: hypothetical protein A2058_05900 [Ignavibacteria bacterium GWA2_36_19]OGU56424.1 MAG: hypothetical protein A2X60_15365 [Ignavibacteria bacterium GWF2_35_20]OGU90838.1 MAG: hypothetical protein A3K31_12440 [Ignavibacteria bacterium RIFOXYA12_FULL_35_25]OGU91513.1 MAG: hypothetical protein A2492_02670 [Ignavibacteria bacterium RIFOXYC12_FULL_35_11]OGU94496.1 MAG: hypothetical protein A2347_03045 [Ignavibacteria bacterium RIFOXYB12_FULL_35_14]OGU99686.1 MAG: hypothetical protein A2455_171